MFTNKEIAEEIRAWLISYAEIAGGTKPGFGRDVYVAKMEACVQIAEGCGLVDHDDAIELWSHGQDMTRDEIAAMFKEVK